MKIKLILLFLIYFVFNSCTKKEELNNSSCAVIDCVGAISYFKLKFIDKNTEVDLLFGTTISGIKYALGDVKIFSNRFKKNLDFRIDSTDKTKKYLLFSTEVTDEFTISLANNITDNLQVETKFINQPCCNKLELTKLTLNNSAYTFSNTSPTIILLKK